MIQQLELSSQVVVSKLLILTQDRFGVLDSYCKEQQMTLQTLNRGDLGSVPF